MRVPVYKLSSLGKETLRVQVDESLKIANENYRVHEVRLFSPTLLLKLLGCLAF